MSRENRFQTGTENPAKFFFSWKSEQQAFCYYDKTEQKNVFLKFPFTFLALAPYKTVTGYNSKRKSGIYSNEVKSLKDEMHVRYFDDKETIAKGDWATIKDDVDSANGRYTESVYIMLDNGDVANIKITGAALSTWFEFQKNQQSRFLNDWVVVNSYREGKQGSVAYSYPVFEWGTSLSKSHQIMADAADDKIKEYELHYFGQSATESQENYRERSEVDKYEMNANKPPVPPSHIDAELAMHEAAGNQDDDDLPF